MLLYLNVLNYAPAENIRISRNFTLIVREWLYAYSHFKSKHMYAHICIYFAIVNLSFVNYFVVMFVPMDIVDYLLYYSKKEISVRWKFLWNSYNSLTIRSLAIFFFLRFSKNFLRDKRFFFFIRLLYRIKQSELVERQQKRKKRPPLYPKKEENSEEAQCVVNENYNWDRCVK